MSQAWNPELYLRYAAYRARPADDLLPRIHLKVPGDIYDLGCGPGTLTKRLKDKWPDRRVTGVDSSPDMLAAAREKFPSGIDWQLADIASWSPSAPPALIFANASLQWLPDHGRLMPRLMSLVMAGGVLAIQVPESGTQTYHRCIESMTRSPRWRERLKGVHPHEDPLSPRAYYDLVAPLAADIDVWETDYHHVLEGDDPVTEWISSTGLGPFLSVLSEAEKPAFLADYSACAKAAYPRQADNKVLFTMRRLFLLAVRR
jgi:trans-aconitate 2-methyltransferase